MKSVTYTVTYDRAHWRARSPETIGTTGSKSLMSLRRELIDNASWLHRDTEDEQVEITFIYDLPEGIAPALAVAHLEAEPRTRGL